MMTRFQQEVNGLLGQWWVDHAEKEAQKAVEKARKDAYVQMGVIRWKSNDRCLMDDFCEMLEYMGYPFDRRATAMARDKDNDAFLAECRANYKGPSEEELVEMRTAFGEDEVIVDVITGERIYL